MTAARNTTMSSEMSTPRTAQEWTQHAVACQKNGKLPEAASAFQQALKLEPNLPRTWNSLGITNIQLGNPLAAEEAFRKAVEIDPAYEKAIHNLANVLAEQGKHAEAVVAYHRAELAGYREPSLYDGWAGELAAQGDLRSAERMLQKALKQWPDDARLLKQLGKVLSLQFCWDGAAACTRRAVQLQPNDPESQKLLGQLFIRQGRLDQAERHLRNALRLKPHDVDAGTELGISLLQQAKLDEADTVFRQVLSLQPDHVEANGYRLYLLNYDHRRSPESVLREHQDWAKKFANATPANATDFPNNPNPKRRLRIGYISPDFRRHPVGRFMEPILIHHDSSRVEIFCYDEGLRVPDEVTARLQSRVSNWRLCRGMSAAKFMETVRADQIDILVELTGHTADNRLSLLARRLAPIQVSYLGYPNTTGVPAIDYFITDPITAPEDQPTFLTETAVRLPNGFSCFAPRDDAPAVSPLPAERAGFLTFAAPHALGKVNSAVLDLWAKLLLAVPNSRLVIARNTLGLLTRNSLAEKFATRGITEDRIVLRQLASGEGEYLGFYREVDITLDTFPWNGHTTSCESLWMGVPTITLRGKTHASRMVASIMTYAGLADWVADTPEQYVDIAKKWSVAIPKLAKLRAGMRERMRQSKLCHGPGFTRQLEDAYSKMWQNWCSKKLSENAGKNEPIREPKPSAAVVAQQTVSQPPTSAQPITANEAIARAKELIQTQPAQAESIGRQIVAQIPKSSEAWAILADACKAQGKMQDAVTAYCRTLELQPLHPSANNSLGIHYASQKNLAAAESHFRNAIKAKPDYTRAYNNLGNVLSEQGKFADASAMYARADQLGYKDASLLKSWGLALARQNRFEDAIALFQRAAAENPKDPMIFRLLGNANLECGKYPQAVEAYQKAEKNAPDDPGVYDGMTQAFLKMSEYSQAIRPASEAVRLKPKDTELLKRLGFVFNKVAKFEASVDAYQRAIDLRPDDAEAHWRLGMVHTRQGYLDKAIACHLEAVRLQPNVPGYWNGLSSTYIQNGDIDESLEAVRKSIALNPDYAEAYSSMLFTLCYDPKATPEAVFEEHKSWANRFAPPLASTIPLTNDPNPNRKIRIGYVSPDLRNHPVGFFIEPVILNHDLNRVELVCYDECVWPPDQLAARLQKKVPTWRISRGMTDLQLAEQIRADKIDVLVDLAGHTASNRLRLFVHRPAPVQITYLGYPNTSGIRDLDYFLSDPIADPPDQPLLFTEEVYHLPNGFCVFSPRGGSPDVAPSPASRNGFITFGSMHNQAKLNPRVLDLWAEVLKAVPTARLMFVRHTLTEEGRQVLRKAFANRNVDSTRLDFRQPRAGSSEYTKHYAEIDIQLDTFPWTGHTTGCESLWLGVPLISLRGNSHAGRMVASVLTYAGLPDWVADTPEQYVDLARKWAANIPALSALRAGLREKVRHSKLCDAPGFSRQIEDAFYVMWKKWCGKRTAQLV